MNMKRTLTLFCLSALVCHSAWALPAKTNDIPITMYSDGGHDFKQFSKRVSGYSDQYFHFHFDQSMTGVSPSFKMSYPPDGSTTNRTTVLSVTTNFTVSTTNITFFVDRTNLVMRPRTYHAELWGDVTATDIGSPLARGKVTITKSLFDQQGDTEAFPVANTDIYTYVSGQLTNTYIPRSLLTTIGDTIWYSNDWRRLPIGDAGQAIGTDDGTNICFITTVGSGDTLAATYDPAVNGIVDTSDAHIAWTNIGVGSVAVTNATLTESTSNAVSVSSRTVAIVVNTNYAGPTALLPADTNGWVVTDTTYTAGTNLDLNGTEFSLDAAAQASDDLADSATQPADLADHTTNTLVDGAHGGELDPNYAADSNAIITHIADTANPHTVTLQQAVTAGGTVTTGAVTIDAANARTNTFGGALTVLGGRVESSSGTASGVNGATALGSATTASGNYGATAFGYNTVASGDWGATAGGRNAQASNAGTFVMSDAQSSTFSSTSSNQCRMRYANGYDFTGGAISGNASGLTSLPAANLTGNIPQAAMTNAVEAALATQAAAGESNVVTSAGLVDIATEIGLANTAMQDLSDDATPTLGGNLDADGKYIIQIDYTSYETNNAAIAARATELLQYVKDGRKWYVYGTTTNYMELE